MTISVSSTFTRPMGFLVCKDNFGRDARLTTGMPATALALLEFHQLDSFERFIRSFEIPLSQALPGAICLLPVYRNVTAHLPRSYDFTGCTALSFSFERTNYEQV
jgi:hypothetical protein